jgi:hypothetical protein
MFSGCCILRLMFRQLSVKMLAANIEGKNGLTGNMHLPLALENFGDL